MMSWVPKKIKRNTVSKMLDMFNLLGLPIASKDSLPVGNMGLSMSFVEKYENKYKQRKAREKREKEMGQ